VGHEGFSYLLVVSVFLTPCSFSVTFLFFPLVFVLFYSAENKQQLKRGPSQQCSSNSFHHDSFGDHFQTRKVKSADSQVHDWVVDLLGGIFGSVGHRVRIHKITPASGKERDDLEIKHYVVLQKPQEQTDLLPPPRTLILRYEEEGGDQSVLERQVRPGHFWLLKFGKVPGNNNCVEKKFELVTRKYAECKGVCFGNGDCALVVDVWFHRVDEDGGNDRQLVRAARHRFRPQRSATVTTRGGGAWIPAYAWHGPQADSRHGYQEVCTLRG
jgi:hypothetical protein